MQIARAMPRLRENHCDVSAISGAMVQDKLQAVRDAGASVLVSADCGCLLNMHHAAEKLGGAASGRWVP